MTVCGIVLIWIAGFVLIFGLHAIIVAGFPFGFLLLMIPIPAPALKHFVSFLQYSSAYMSGLLFRAFRVPALPQGLTISLPGIDIEVAEQCSGIRSSIALVLASGLAGFVLLRGSLNRLFLVFITLPIVVFKNAVRIVALSSLALYVDRGFLFGRLHRYGGLCFSFLDLAIVVPLLLQLHKSEARHRTKSLASASRSIYGETREP
jgi:exosortase